MDSAGNPAPDAGGVVPASQRLTPGPYRKVGNILIVHVVEHPFKYGWELNRALRKLKLEYRGEVRVMADTPKNRQWLFRVRHIVKIDMMNTDEVKEMLGIPASVSFSALKQNTPRNFGTGIVRDFDSAQSFADFAEVRRMRLRDIMQRDAVELRLLQKRKEAAAAAAGAPAATSAADALKATG
jgi:ribosomal protein L30/L7E